MTSVMTPRRAAISTAAAVAVMLAACGGEPEGSEPEAGAAETAEPMPGAASVTITQPLDGAVVEGGAVLVTLEVSNLTVVPSGTQGEGTGHHHLIVDGALPAPDVPIPPNDDVHIHMGGGETEFELTGLAPGEHTLIAVVGDWVHVPLDPWVVDTVTFVVQ